MHLLIEVQMWNELCIDSLHMQHFLTYAPNMHESMIDKSGNRTL